MGNIRPCGGVTDWTVPAMNRVRLRGPEHLIAAVPYLVGFIPHDSVIMLLLDDATSVILTVRHDLPRNSTDIAATVDILESAIRSSEATAVVIVLWSGASGPAELDVGAAALVPALVDAAGALRIPVRDALVVFGDRWRSALCASPVCCPPQGHQIDAGSVDAIRLPFVLDGRSPAGDRAQVEQLYSPLPDEHPCVQQLREAVEREVQFLQTDRPTEAGEPLVQWRREQARSVLTLLGQSSDSESESSLAERARAVIVLQNIHVRDLVIKALVDHPDPRQIENQVRLLARSTPMELQAPVFALSAALSWQRGDGSRANMALDSALLSNPGYSLAVLLRRAIRAGLPPSRWLEAVRQTSEHECAAGGGPSAA
jgi:hypothetical protein